MLNVFSMRAEVPAITCKFLIIQNMNDYIPYIIYLLRALCFSIALWSGLNQKCVRKVLRCTQGQKYTNINLQYVYPSGLQIKLIYKGLYRYLKYEKYKKYMRTIMSLTNLKIIKLWMPAPILSTCAKFKLPRLLSSPILALIRTYTIKVKLCHALMLQLSMSSRFKRYWRLSSWYTPRQNNSHPSSLVIGVIQILQLLLF